MCEEHVAARYLCLTKSVNPIAFTFVNMKFNRPEHKFDFALNLRERFSRLIEFLQKKRRRI